MPLDFPRKLSSYSYNRNAVSFLADDGRDEIICFIRIDALQKQFGLESDDGDEAVSVFEKNRYDIEAAASDKYDKAPDKDVILTAKDF